jgi:hypothetical protein
MNKVFLLPALLLVIVFAFMGCKKDQPTNSSLSTYDVQFNINSVTQNGSLKSSAADSVVCDSGLLASYVVYKIDGGPFDTIPVFYVGNVPWTNTIKLTAGQHTLDEFLVYSDNNTPNNKHDDILLWATPHTGSPWAGYVTTPLNMVFTVFTDKKNSIKMDVVCFRPAAFNNFGFIYFSLNQIIIRQQWFFGDFCIKNASQYSGSDYTHQPNWVSSGYIDAPAIFRIDVLRGGVLQNSFTNDDAAHQYGNKVSVTYGDIQNQVDAFTFNLYILVRQGPAFNFVLFYTWTFNDISNIPIGSDGVTDFVLGSCYDPSNPPQLILPPYMNLPSTATYTIVGNYAPGSLGAYVDAQLTNVPSGYLFSNGTYASDCADHEVTINVGQAYNMDVYSSLYPALLPTFAQEQTGKWAKINWVFNHQNWYPNIKWYELQQLVWLYDESPWNGSADGGVPALNDPLNPTRALQMESDANTYGTNYVPSPGGYAAVIFIEVGTPPQSPNIQTMFIQFDP